MQLKYEVFARWFAILLILETCMPHFAEGGMSSWFNHDKQKDQEIPNGCFKQTLKEPDLQDPYKYIETERLVCPNAPAIAEYPQSGPFQFQQPPQIWQPYQTEQHPLQPGQILYAANGQNQYSQAIEQQPLQPVQQQIQPQQVQPQLPPSQQSQSFYPLQQSQFPYANNPGQAVHTQFQKPAEEPHLPQPAEDTETTTKRPKFFQSLVDKVMDFKNTKGEQLKEAASKIVSKYQTFQASKAEKHSEQANQSGPQPAENTETTTKRPKFFQSLVDKVMDFKNTKGEQLKETASTIVSKYQTFQASKAEKQSEQADKSMHPFQNDTSQDSSKKKGFFGKSSSAGIWKFNIISMLLIPFSLILLQ
ncbi:putative uncharacterized protein DDB_G0271606 isoform X2 [Eurosta solidaginis]|uniref:putative uncharacterized protein DDB_G0271606 isoform X2 n=1 Tax=Eurosta solidaginis TaxID=178769 RepID=UPI003531220D